jgi:hypothetical protein
MHRSGTSAITRGLQALGVNLGDSLLPPVAGDNQKGYFEDFEINKLNIELLTSLGSDWHDLSLIPAATFDQENVAPFKLRAIELIRARLGHRPYALKDPRMARLLPFWKTVFDHLKVQPSYIISVRHPMSVVQSLKQRGDFDSEKGYYLWLEHLIPAILETVGANRVVVDFDLLIADPHSQLNRIAQELNLPFSQGSPEVLEYVRDFLDEELRHSQCTFEDLFIDPTVPLDVIKAYEEFLRLAVDETKLDSQRVISIFESLNSELRTLAPAFRLISRVERRLIERISQIVDFIKVVNAREEQIVGLHQVVSDREAQIVGLHQVVSDREAQIVGLNQVVVKRENQITNLERQQNIINTELFRLTSDAATFGAKIGRGITRLRARITPVGTRRGQIVSLSGKFASKLFSNGLKNTISHTFNYISLRLRFKLPGRFLGERVDDRRDFIETIPEILLKTQGEIRTDHPQLASWIAVHEPDRDQLATQKLEESQFKYRPLISVIIPIYRVPREVLIETLECLTEQTYTNWQACIVWADSENLAGWEWFKKKVNTDRRFKFKYLEQNGGISKNSNAALELAEGEFVALLDHDDVLSPWAFYEVVRLLQSSPQLDFIYSDKNSITADGKFRLNALFKPEWSPEMLHSVNFLTHLNVIRTRLLLEIDGWDSETDGAQDWDLFFRLTERTTNIARLASILYHWRILPTSTASGLQAKPYAAIGQLKSQQNHFKRMGLAAVVMPTPEGLFHVNWPVQPLSTDVVIYQTGSLAQLVYVLDLLRAGEQEAIRNIYVLHSSPSSEALLAFQHVWEDRFVLVPCTSVNWRAALTATVEYNDRRTVLLLDGSAVGMSVDLVEELAGWVAQHPDISWSSAIAMNADGTVYEAGRVVASDFQSAPMFNGSSLFSFGWFGSPLWYRNAQAASPYAVTMNARDITVALSSLDESLEQGPSFTKFCLSLIANGRRGLINPFAKVYFDKPPESHWPNHGLLYHSDPYFNPAFDQVSPLRLQQ